ncbi:type IVa pilus pseudopilin TppB [Oleiagrimonas citrea]|nr:type IV pilus modification protein PilV [Oleiagrimonas citrea]
MKRSLPIFAHRSKSASVQGGVGLIEVMIAVLVLSIGFLGVGALLAMSLSTNNSAMARSMATVNSYSILDAMRADLTNAKAGNYNTTVIANACPSASGSLAAFQLNAWCAQLGHDMGAEATTKGTVNCDNVGECTITIEFDDSRAGVGGGKKQQVITKAIL